MSSNGCIAYWLFSVPSFIGKTNFASASPRASSRCTASRRRRRLEQPKQTSFGELAIPAAFQLARQLKKAPPAIAREIVADIGPIEGVPAIEVAGQRLHQRPPGSRRVRLRRAARARRTSRSGNPARSSSSTPTSIPTKPRTSAICATRSWATRSCACCAPAGRTVEVQNYIDNTGVQVADVVVGFLHPGKMSSTTSSS